ncbi:Tyrocidine synthase 3 [Pseudoalteromonas sp. P1-9]|nr:Tyrocidine synthase 3 [Pseudoalteromonas sp. P1-9]
MVFHTQLEEFNGVFHDISSDHIQYQWDQQAFEKALSLCVQQHALLRTVYKLDGERPLQLVKKSIELPLTIFDIRDKTLEQQDSYLEEWREQHKTHVFNWENGPLYQVVIFLRSEHSFEFVISFHHSILDGWSRVSLTTELYGYYAQLLKGESIQEPKQDWVYRQFVALENSVMASPAAEKFFRETTESLPGIQLPRQKMELTDSRLQDYFWSQDFIDLSPKLVQLAKSLGVPVQVVLITGHLKALSILSGKEKSVASIAVNGRPEIDGAEQGLGLFLNAIPIAGKMRGFTYRELIENIGNTYTQSLNYRRYPQESIQKLTDSAFDEVLFNYTHFHQYEQVEETAQEDGVSVLNSNGFEQTNYPLQLDFTRGNHDEIGLNLIYKTELFTSEFIEQVAGYHLLVFKNMLQNLDALPEADVLLTQKDIGLYQAEFTTAAEIVDELPIHHLFTVQAAKSPDKIAIFIGNESITYSELSKKVNQFAQYMTENGVKEECLVGVCQERTINMVATLLAIHKAGGAYLPLDPSYPVERLNYMLADSGAKVVITDDKTSSSLAKNLTIGTEINVDSEGIQQQINQYQSDTVPFRKSETDLAYVIYTSGSTGKPKGVMVEQGNLSNLIHSMHTRPGVNEADKILAVTPISFDIHVVELFLPLIRGAQVILCPRETTYDAHGLVDLLDSHKISFMQATPATWRMLKEGRKWPDNLDINLLTGGEALAPELAAWMNERAKSVWNLYGPTEITVYGTGGEVLADDEKITIGTPVANAWCYILDENQRQSPIGSIGELYIGGKGVTRGYLNRQELTNEKFIDNPFDKDAGKRLYRTGDLVKYVLHGNQRGQIEYLGRTDEQVKIRGYRIELGEIEEQIRKQRSVTNALVLVTEEQGDKQLVAYVTLNNENETQHEVINRLKRTLSVDLPAFMIPTSFVILDKFPLTPSGKFDKKALPAPQRLPASEVEYVAPRNDIEKRLVDIWSELLALPTEKISIKSDFFELGGSSLLAVRLVGLLSETDIPLSVKQVYEKPSIMELAAINFENTLSVEQRSAIKLNNNDNAQPLFLFPPAGGKVEMYSEIAKALEDFTSVWGIQAPYHTLDNYTFASYQELADFYISVVKHVQPSGKYRLGGWSAGGNLAHIIAEKLQKEGHEVEYFFAIDSVITVDDQLDKLPLYDCLEYAVAVTMNDLDLYESIIAKVPDNLREEDYQAQLDVFAEIIADFLPEYGFSVNAIRSYLDYFVTVMAVDRSGAEISLTKQATLFLASDKLEGVDDNTDLKTHSWQAAIKDCPSQFVYLPGTHFSMIERGQKQMVSQIIQDLS